MNEKTCTVFVQDVSHNINLMRIGKYRKSKRISLLLNIAFFCLLVSAAIVFGLVPSFTSALPGAGESVSTM